MIDRAQIHGVVVPIITSLCTDGETIHERGVQQQVDRLLVQGVHGIFAGGTTGEVWALDDEQWSRLVRCSREAVSGRVPLYVGVSHHSTVCAVARARLAEKLGADIIVSLAPYYIAPTQGDILRHFEALAAATACPVIVYQYPGIVKTSISLSTYAALAAIPGIAGVKDSQANVTEFANMIQRLRADGRDFRLLLGTDELAAMAVMLGGQGIVSAFANVAGGVIVQAYEAALAGRWRDAAAAQARVMALKGIYRIPGRDDSLGSFIAATKCAVELLGIEAGPPALPVRRCDDAENVRDSREFFMKVPSSRLASTRSFGKLIDFRSSLSKCVARLWMLAAWSDARRTHLSDLVRLDGPSLHCTRSGCLGVPSSA